MIERITPADLDRLEALTAEELRIHRNDHDAAKASLLGQFHVQLAAIAGNEVLTEMLGKLVARLSLVMALYEDERQDDCGAEHHAAIVAALRTRDLKKAQTLMDGHLADIEGSVKLTPGQSERHSFLAVLETFTPA